MSKSEILCEVFEEMDRSSAKYGEPTSTHESMGVLLEEFHELIAAVRSNKRESIAAEAIQVASVAARLADSCRNGPESFMQRSGI